MHREAIRLLTLALAFAFWRGSEARMVKRALTLEQHLLQRRQGVVVGTGTATQPVNFGQASLTPVTNNPIAQVSTTAVSSTPLLDSIINDVTSASLSPTLSLPAIISSATDILLSSSVPSSSSRPATSSSLVTSRSSDSEAETATTIDITSTQPVESASASASAAPDNDSSSMGIGKKTIIIVASVAGSVGLLAAIWTILRKTKFSPSRRFEARLNPIDWTPADDLPPPNSTPDMNRSGSDDSLSLKRGNSWGSAAGSQRGGMMSEVGYGSRNNVTFNGAAPAYPPGVSRPPYSPPYPASTNTSTYTIANASYEPVTRQASQLHGGRYGEGYTSY